MTFKRPPQQNSMPNSHEKPKRVGYVLKRYPRFSETFVVNEILAHEAAGMDINIFALRPTVDSHFQHAIADVRAPVTYLRYGGIKAETLWSEMATLGQNFPETWSLLAECPGYTAVEVYQALLLAREVREQGIEHLHAHFATTAAAVARLASLLTSVPYSFTAHAKDIFHETVDEELLGLKIADASSVVTVSDFNVEHLHERFPRSAERIRRIYNGLNLAGYAYSDPAERQPLIAAVGRLVEKKGFADLIDACARLTAMDVPYRCVILGGGDLAEPLQEKIREQSLDRQVTLLGPQSQTEVLKMMRQAAMLVAPCITASTGDRDGLPTVLLEAMACGTPCISTEVTGIPEVVRHNDTGLLVPEQQPKLLAGAIRQLLTDGEQRVRLASAARKLIEDQFDIERNAAKLRELFATSHYEMYQPSLAEVG